MNNKLIEALEAERSKSQNYQSNNTSGNKPEIKKDKMLSTPHLAVTHTDQGGAASGRNRPLLMKSHDHDLEAFIKCMKDDDFILELYVFVKDAEPEIFETIINKGKSL